MYILSVDTTAKTASVCVSLVKNASIFPISQINLNSTLTHSESLLPMIDKCLSLATISLEDISLMAASAGPGSFTGVRIGVSVIKGLGASQKERHIPCVPVSTLGCLAENISNYSPGTILCPCMDARREQLYNAMFKSTKSFPKRLCDDRVITTEDLCKEISEKYENKKIVLCGDGAFIFLENAKNYINPDTFKISVCHPKDLYQSAFSVACCAYAKYTKAKDTSIFSYENLVPLYLRLSQAERELLEKNNKK